MELNVNGRQTVRPTDQQVFDHLKCEVIESSRHTLVKSLMPDRHMDFLRSKRILSKEDCEEIKRLPTYQKQASMFLDIMEQKGAEAYDALCASLKEEGTQMFLLRLLHEDFEQRQRRYRELVGQQKSTQSLLDLSPPPLRPPPPPPSLHPRPQGHPLTPTEHVYPAFLPHPSSHPDPTESCPGYSSQPTYPTSCSFSTPPLTNGSCVTLATEVNKEERAKVVDLKKERLNVAAYLQSLTIRQNEAVDSAKNDSSPGPGLTEMASDSSLERQLPTFLSSAATYGSSAGSASSASLDQTSPSAALPVPTQDSQGSLVAGDRVVRRHQHQRLSSRGSLQEMGIAELSAGGMSTPVGGASVPVEGVSTSFVSVQSPEPVENEDTSTGDSSVENSSFFGSLANESLVLSSSGISSSSRTILCDAAINDQHQALGKCHYAEEEGRENVKGEEMGESFNPKETGESFDPKEVDKSFNSKEMDESFDPKEIDESVYPKRLDTSSADLPSHLPCMAIDHNTDRKIFVQSSSDPELSQSGEVKESLQSSTQEKDVKEKEEGVGQKQGFVFEEGVSRELRSSVSDKSGRSVYSSQC